MPELNNERIKIDRSEILAKGFFTFEKYFLQYKNKKNIWEKQEKEILNKGHAASALLYNPTKKTVLLTKQFRLPALLTGQSDPFLIECCAGMLDDDSPEACIKREILEETGYQVEKVEKIFEAFMSPGSITEIIHFFIAEYDASMKVHAGGGLEEEHEDIEVLEMPFSEANNLIRDGSICDAKTIMLLQYATIHKLI